MQKSGDVRLAWDLACYVDACAVLAGIGKSILGYLLLYRWAVSGKRVIFFDRAHIPEPVILHGQTAAYLTHAQLQNELEQEDTM